MSLKELLIRSIDALKVDYIVEEGTSGIWTYEKWASGNLKMWGHATGTASFTRTWGGLYICDAITVDYPFTFVSPPVVNMSSSAVSLVTFGGGSSTVSSVKIQAGRGTSASSYNYSIALSVKGRWK